ncbi:unnamed protein product [Ranitomeya imitator]|uniref:Leucine-rich repeat-containing protein 41 n=1 Tax=Ranitomeya imitator TaxID=111125 RepID=A0ABN9KT83_9NEOB|nr:unnamed protein product [Ranitomeya imitator]
MNIYYLERIEQTAVQKGLSTQSIWCKLWNDIMKSKPSRFGTVTCWRKKFLESFFHNVLRGILDVSSDHRLIDHRFSPLMHSSRHVSELTICNKQQGVTELPQAVVECLTQSVETLKFLHLRSSDPARRSPCACSCTISSTTGGRGEGSTPETTPKEEKAGVGASPLLGVIHYRSVRALNLHNVPLTLSSCRSLCHLLCSWTALERLTMAYNDLGANIQLVLESLSALSRAPSCCLRVFSLSDFTTFVPMLELAHAVLRIFPQLQLLSLSYDLESPSEWVRAAEVTVPCAGVTSSAGVGEAAILSPHSCLLTVSAENRLQTLELRFPQDPVQVERLVSVLTASRSLLELSLDNATFPGQDDLRRVLRVIADGNTSLRRLSFHDMKMSDAHCEILHLLNHSRLEEMKFSFCRLFEEGSGDFLMDFVAAIKRNPNVRILKLSGNRLGNEGLCVLADLFSSSDAVCGIHYLDVR